MLSVANTPIVLNLVMLSIVVPDTETICLTRLGKTVHLPNKYSYAECCAALWQPLYSTKIQKRVPLDGKITSQNIHDF